MKNKKLEPIEVLAKIKALISRFYEEIGRSIRDDIEIARDEVISAIDKLLRRTDIPTKLVIVEKLQMEKDNEFDFLR
jgi:hypothetical protein